MPETHRVSEACRLTGCGKTLWVRRNFTGLHVWGKPGLSGPSGLFGLSCVFG